MAELLHVVMADADLIDEINTAIASMTDASISREVVYAQLLQLHITEEEISYPNFILSNGADLSHLKNKIRELCERIRYMHPDMAMISLVYHEYLPGSIIFIVTQYKNRYGIINPKFE